MSNLKARFGVSAQLRADKMLAFISIQYALSSLENPETGTSMSLTLDVDNNANRIGSDEDRWQSVVARDPAADGTFFYSVKSTGVYCRNICAARLPLRKNVRFYATIVDAEAAGFRPCRRCKPSELGLSARRTEAIARACRLIESSESEPSLKELASAVQMSPYHFHRLFKRFTGITPKAYAKTARAQRLRGELAQNKTVTQAFYNAGFNSSSRFYNDSTSLLGMSPKVFQRGGRGETIRFMLGSCWLGKLLVAASARGLCSILLGDDSDDLETDLRRRFPFAQLEHGDDAFEASIAAVIRFLDEPTDSNDLPLDIRGTAFQQRVWQELRTIPQGSTVNYTEVAERIGKPTAVRAVASACAANPLAVVIPCHRVVRADGALSGYRWGLERKRRLLEREVKLAHKVIPNEDE